jgi:hypothetical protein
MSGNVPQRCKQLGISEFFSIPVMPEVAKLLETITLRRLGVPRGGAEWVWCSPESAKLAAIDARDELSRVCHADPALTPAEAAMLRQAQHYVWG